MADAWTWLALAASGTLHGLNPIAGWGLVAVSGDGPAARVRALPALAPVAIGHAAGVALLAGGFASGAAAVDVGSLRLAAGAMLAVVALCHLPASVAGATLARLRRPARCVALAAWSFAMSVGHGLGLMLVPALMATCSSARTGSGDAVAAVAAAVGVHTLAMLATSAALVLAGRRVAGRWLDRVRARLGDGDAQAPAAAADGASGCRARHARKA